MDRVQPLLAQTQALPPWLVDNGVILALAISVGLLVLASVLLAMMLLARRQQRHELRELVTLIEELRSGQTQQRVQTDPRSPAALVGDAVNRLAQDLAVRWNRGEHAARQLDGLLDVLGDHAIVEADADWEIRRCTAGTSELFGWSARDLVGRATTTLFDPESWKSVLPKLARRSSREHGVATRARMLRQDGSAFDAELKIRTHHTPGGEAVGYVLVVRDVSSQVRLEDRLREAEARYHRLVESLHQGVAVVRDGQVIYSNQALAGLLGTGSDDLVGASLRQYVSTADLLVLGEALEGRAEAELPRTMAATLIAHDGMPLSVQLRLDRVEDGDGPAILLTVRDDSAARSARAELQLNEARLDAVLESTSDGVVVLSSGEQRAITMTNAAFARLLDLGAAPILGQAASSLIDLLDERGAGYTDVAAFLRGHLGAAGEQTVTLDGPDGQPPRTISLRTAPLTGSDGASLGLVLVCRDLTDQRVVERQLELRADELQRSKLELEQSHRELGAVEEQLRRRIEQLDGLNRELRKLDEMKSNLLANVSHELQTPLVSIRGYTEMILKGRLGAITEEQSKGLRLSLRNIDRLIAMIDNLLLFARMDRDVGQLDPADFPLQPLIEETIALLRDKIQERGLMVAWEFEEPAVVVHADRDKIVQVFLNLFSNAVKFNRNGGRIDVGVSRGEPGYIEVQVRDTGVGISADALERIFDRFYRAAEPASQRGSGIGLAIVRNILQLHGCTIRAESRLGEGSKFRFTLPVAERKIEQPDPPVERDEVTDVEDGGDVDNEGRPRRFRIIRHDEEAGN